MLAFDIETTGLDPDHSLVTVVCTEDFETGERRAYEFARVRACEPQNEDVLRTEMIKAFDEATSLCAFNGVRFDIPFLHKALGLSDATTSDWLFKITDILESARLGMFGPAHTFGLNLLCQHNQIKVKSGCGLQAIKFAQEQKWDELKTYCADDVRILCDLYRRRFLNNPRFHNVIDLSLIAHVNTYVKQSNKHASKKQKDTENDTKLCAEVVDLRNRLLFHQEHIFASCDAEAAFAELLSENARQKTEIDDLQKKLAVYNEYCVCFEDVL